MRWRLAAGLAAVGTVLVVVVVLMGAGRNGAAGDPPPGADVSASGALRVDISAHAGGPRIPSGFLGLSIEFQAVRAYTGSNPAHVNPVLEQLIRNLFPGQAPVLRIGGDSTDISWLPGPGVKPLSYTGYRLTSSWLATTAALASGLHARMTMGVNLAANQPALARAQARAYLRSMGRARLAALEIGNEPNVYGKIALLPLPGHRFRKARSRSFDYGRYQREFSALAAATGRLPLAAPALAVGPTADAGSWVQSIGTLLAQHRRVRVMTLHRYPLRNCFVGPRSRQYPTVAHLLSSYSTVTLAAGLRRWIAIARSHHRPLRVDELNSVACRGKPGVSDTFASSLWVTEALFSLARAGVDGINMHTLPRAAYELFHFTHPAGRWQAYVQPVYYGLQLFAQAAPPGARILAVHRPTGAPELSVWATRARDGALRVILINKSRQHSRAVSLAMPPGTGHGATVTRLRASGVDARTGVTLGGQGYGSQTTSGSLGSAHVQTLERRGRTYTLSVPQGSAALVTFTR
ncbi:MAG: glycosyl hydrolase family 79 C-terminal domain-containing protein [Actinomycetota bacterium]|nr:glycosyl hydrolase family 79 C-terminal domain-containing protein [Actinomycetota bacterium]